MSVATLPNLCRPAFLWVPEGSTFGAAEECADMCRLLGDDVDQPEADLLRVLLAEGPAGTDRWAGLEAGVFCGRQNLKTWGLKRSVMYDAWVRDVKRITWSAQLYKTTQEVFNDIAAEATNIDWLRKRVKKIRFANGEEGIEFTNGATMDFVARSAKAARGLAADTVVLDEALYLTPAMMGALLPTLSTRPKPHVRYGSSPGLEESAVARAVRDRGRRGGDQTLAYVEWTSQRADCADPDCLHGPDASGCLLDDEERWHQANPALGRRITVDYVRAERRALPPEEFMRERLGWWSDPPAAGDLSVFPAEAWFACRDDRSAVPESAPFTVSVDVSWDREHACIAVAGIRDDDLRHVEVMKYDEGTDWVVPYLLSRRRQPLQVVVQGTGAPAASLLDDLDKAGLPVERLSGTDVGKACGGIYDAVVSGRLRYVSSPVLERAVNTAVARPMGDAWALDRKRSPTDISPLVACTYALWALEAQQGRTPSIINVWEDDDDA